MSLNRRVLLLFLAALLFPHHVSAQRRFRVDGDHFALDGKRFQIISGEMHYARIPREYWRARLKMARAMGLNTISTYVFWDLHEPRPGEYDFNGQLDVAAFVRMAKEEGLYVILRPGPYVCSEWDLGGLPPWLFATPDIVLRSADERFLKPSERWLARLGRELAPLQIDNGGPILAVQVENEYGSFDNDHAYMRRIYDALRAAGFTGSLLYTADGPAQLSAGALPDVPAVVNLGPGDAKAGLETLARFRPGAPGMIGEWWAGWFDHWGRPHHTTDGEAEAKELDWILSNGYSINIYMFHGGSTPGFMNGANNDRSGYWPDTSSYDYSAALDESGRPTPKYFLFREIIAKHTGQHLSDVPALPAPISLPEIRFEKVASLFDHLPLPVSGEKPRPMEELGQSYGYILYRTTIHGPVSGDLVLRGLHDYARVYVNGKLVGELDRRLKQDRIAIKADQSKAELDILVENTGRINFTKALREERSGITESVALAGKELSGWQIYPLSMNDRTRLKYVAVPASGPAFYRATFQSDRVGDTFLDLRTWTKGTVWVNGHHLGRFWNIGPQQTLYLPGPWLRRGTNEIVIFDLEPNTSPAITGLEKPILDGLRGPSAQR